MFHLLLSGYNAFFNIFIHFNDFKVFFWKRAAMAFPVKFDSDSGNFFYRVHSAGNCLKIQIGQLQKCKNSYKYRALKK